MVSYCGICLSYIIMFLKVDDSENEFNIIKARLKVETKQILRNIQPKKNQHAQTKLLQDTF